MKIEHLNVVAGSWEAVRIISVWADFMEGDTGLTLSELAGIDSVASEIWRRRLLALGIIEEGGGVDPRALVYAQQQAALRAGIERKPRSEKEGENPSTTTQNESRGK